MTYSLADIQEKAADLKKTWNDRNTNIAAARRLFFMDHYGEDGASDNLPRTSGDIRPPRTSTPTVDANGAYRVTCSDYTDFIIAIRSMLGANLPIIRCYFDKESKPGDTKTSNAEKLLQAVFYTARYRNERDIIQDFLHAGCVDGWTCVYAYWDEELAEDYDKDDSTWQDFPLVLKVVPAEYAYMREGGKRGRWLEFAYSWKRPIRDIENEWDVRLRKTRAGLKESDDVGSEEVDYIDFWYWGKPDKKKKADDSEDAKKEEKTRTYALWHCVIAGDDWVKPPRDVSNFYRSIPYTMVPFLSTSSTKPGEMAMSLLAPMRPNVEVQEDLLSRVMTTITYNADPVVDLYEDGQRVEYNRGAGAVNHLPPNVKVEHVPGANTTQDVYQMLAFASSAVQRSGLPSISFGQGMSGLSGYAISLMGQGGQMKSVIPMVNIETGLSVVMDKVLDIFRMQSSDKTIKAFGQAQTGKLFTVNMKGNDLKGIRVDVKLKPRVPQDEVARANRARLLKGTVSDHYIKDEVLDMQDPAGDDKRMKQEAFAKSPLVFVMESALAATDMGYPDQMVQSYVQQAMQALAPQQAPLGQRPGNAGPPMAPPGAQMAPPPDERALMDQQVAEASMGNVPSPEGLEGMSQGGQSGGGYS